jgi:hypothetical protein
LLLVDLFLVVAAEAVAVAAPPFAAEEGPPVDAGIAESLLGGLGGFEEEEWRR